MPATVELTRALIDVAMGRKPADLVIRKGAVGERAIRGNHP